MNPTVRKVSNILTSDFNMENYVNLVREIFSTVKIIGPNSFHKEYSNFSSHVEGSYHVGTYESPDKKKIAVFAVQLQKQSFVENSRSTQRSYAKKLIENGNCDAALIAYFTPGDSKWRLSFVRLDFEMKLENGKLKASENITPAKRYSYLVGKDEPCHTAIERFHKFIVDNNSEPTMEELEDAFSVEAVTNEFFELYCEKFYQLSDWLNKNEDFIAEAERCGFTVEQYAKKLLGQIVFLYFLQKKGWMGVGVWPHELTEKEYNNIFFTSGAQGRIIKQYLPQLYLKKEDKYVFVTRALDQIPDQAEELIANRIPGERHWGSGSKTFLRTLYTYSQAHKKHFFENYLEPLFYDTLNRNRGRLGYSCFLHCRIPFLSGGLFEPLDGYDWQSCNFDIPDELFSNKKADDDLEGDGILDIFDRYNFTMSEDEPMEREVAIDPEMLGKVFENLLDVKDRKSKGAFYTPREIVHYMCQESLINYLSTNSHISEDAIRDFILYGDLYKDIDTEKTLRVTDEKGKVHFEIDPAKPMRISEEIFSLSKGVNNLKLLDDLLANIRVADPAVGSGAFPLGMLNEIVRARQNLTAYMAIGMNAYNTRLMYALDRSSYTLKYTTIKNCIFAADIEPSAVDIARLRLWLSLVIDDELNPNAQNAFEGHQNPSPLPNLECNIICGNSLVDEFEGTSLINNSSLIGKEGQLDFNSARFESILPKLIDAQDRLFRCDDTVKKEEIKEEISGIKDMLLYTQISLMDDAAKQRYEESKHSASKPYVLWQIEFAKVFNEKGGFDVVIGNPPYIQLQKSIDNQGTKLGDLYQDLHFETFAKTGDIYCLFYEKGYSLLHDKGVLTFITSNKWMRAGYGKQLRSFLAENTNPVILIDFSGTKIFESATVDVNILSFTKEANKGETLSLTASNSCTDNMSVYIRQNGVSNNFNSDESWVISSQLEYSIQRKIKSLGVPLSEWNLSINYGIKTGYNDAFIISAEKRDELIKEDPRSAEIIRPILRGRDIKRYQYNFAELYVIALFPSRHYDIDDFPAVKKYFLTEFGIPRLEQSGKRHIVDGVPIKSRKKTNNKWFETQDSINYWDDFSKQKIVWGNLCLSAQFALAQKDIYVNAPSPMIVPGNKYILAILNSKIGDWYIRRLGVTRNGGYFEYKPMFVEKLPIPQIGNDQQVPFALLVDQIMKAKENKEDTKLLEQQIDNLAFALYGLNDEEINYILSSQ